MGNSQTNYTERLIRLNIVLFGDIPNEFLNKELDNNGKYFEILEIGNKSYKKITSRNPMHAHYDFFLLDRMSIEDKTIGSIFEKGCPSIFFR